MSADGLFCDRCGGAGLIDGWDMAGRPEARPCPSCQPSARARRSDPITSHEAAASVRKITETHTRLLDLLERRGAMTDEEISAAWTGSGLPPASPSGLRSRRAELVDRGLIADSGMTRLTASGRRTIVWISAARMERAS